MNKAELIDAIAKTTKCSKAQVERILDTTLDTVKRQVKKGDDVKLVGFGTFAKAKRKALQRPQPTNRQNHHDPAATNYPKFKAGREFKHMVR